MPDINSLAEVLTQPDWPYHVQYDNLPLKQILLRENMINDAVDANTAILTAAKGTQVDLAARLSVSLNDDGTLKPTSVTNIPIDSIVDDTLDPPVIPPPGPYVKMTAAERAKLGLIKSGANAISVGYIGASPAGGQPWSQGIVSINDSATINWSITDDGSGNVTMTPQLLTLVNHFYNVTPNTTDYKNYSIIPIIPNSLRVYVNGVRLTTDALISVPRNTISSCTSSDCTMSSWMLLSYTSIDTAGTFQLSQAVQNTDVVRVDYNRT